VSRASGDGTVRAVRIGSFTTDTVADVAEVSTGNVRISVLNWCFGVSMLGRWIDARQRVNPPEDALCSIAFKDVQ